MSIPRRMGMLTDQLTLGRDHVFLVCPARDNLQRIIGQWSLQSFRLVPRRAHPDIASSCVVRITGMALGWIGSTIAFGNVVRKP
jgi:hypothetical protein